MKDAEKLEEDGCVALVAAEESIVDVPNEECDSPLIWQQVAEFVRSATFGM